MRPVDRVFLLSLLAAGGCPADPESGDDATAGSAADGSAASGSGEDSGAHGATGPSDTTDADAGSGGPDGDGTSGDADGASTGPDLPDVPPAVVEACEHFLDRYAQCLDYEAPPGYCDEFAGYVERYLGPDCTSAAVEHFACLSELPCRALEQGDPGPCAGVAANLYTQCPALFPFCSGDGGESPTASTCERTAFSCIDGHEYTVRCEAQTCSCIVDGTVVGTFPGDPDTCEDDDLDAVAIRHCGFSPYTF